MQVYLKIRWSPNNVQRQHVIVNISSVQRTIYQMINNRSVGQFRTFDFGMFAGYHIGVGGRVKYNINMFGISTKLNEILF
uniref:Uncharacterized protein n=1 Tax=Romanomermis culicivorax TaxID=13658 RepID=A0A915IRW3_ROMCU